MAQRGFADADRRRHLTTWLESVRIRFKGRLIGIDEAIAESAGRARAHTAMRGRTVSPLDALIAATAQARSMTLATRNVGDFVSLEVATFDPWSERS